MPYNLYDDISYFHQACRNIVDHQTEKSLNWAVNYAKHGLTVTDKHEAQVQAMYIVGNISRWRGPIAKETRSILKNVIKHWR